MSIITALKLIFLFFVVFHRVISFLNMNNHHENFGGAVYGLFWGFSHHDSHGASVFSPSIIHIENGFIVRILRL